MSENQPHQRDTLAHKHTSAFSAQIEQFRASLSAPSPPTEKETNGTTDIKVLCRIRPFIEQVDAPTSPLNLTTVSNPKAYLHEPSSKLNGEPTLKTHEFIFDGAFGDSSTNEDVYTEAAADLVDWALNGGTAVIFAYGQTGSGKTFTMSDIILNAGREMFSSPLVSPGQGAAARKVQLSIVEILGNNITDLLPAPKNVQDDLKTSAETVAATELPPASKFKRRGKFAVSIRESTIKSSNAIHILEDPFGSIQLHNAAVHEPSTVEEYHDLVTRASRSSATTKMNLSGSSRSHAVCKISVQDLARPTNENGILYLIDLAGSERHVDRAQHDAERLKETKAINSSLMTLKDCIRSRALHSVSRSGDGGSRHVHVPFRASKITLLLKDVFDPEARRPSKCVVITCCSPV